MAAPAQMNKYTFAERGVCVQNKDENPTVSCAHVWCQQHLSQYNITLGTMPGQIRGGVCQDEESPYGWCQ